MKSTAHFDLDSAWSRNVLGIPTHDLGAWGPKLRYCSTCKLMNEFYLQTRSIQADFILFGSGDFHHLTSLFIRRIETPFIVVSFDNHPDWDIRHPKRACGSWINCALALPHVSSISVWGCGNFECWPPHERYGNQRAVQNGQLSVHPWAHNRSIADRCRNGAIQPHTWREEFKRFCESIQNSNVYVTIDLDCLTSGMMWTNWENGFFTPTDIIWALNKLRECTNIIAGDVCGAYSTPLYANRRQRLLSESDHPTLELPASQLISEINYKALASIWPILAQ